MSATSDMLMGSPLGSSTSGHSKLDDVPRSEAEVIAARAKAERERRHTAVRAMWAKLQAAYPDYRHDLITDDMARKALNERERRLWNEEFADAEERRARIADAKGKA